MLTQNLQSWCKLPILLRGHFQPSILLDLHYFLELANNRYLWEISPIFHQFICIRQTSRFSRMVKPLRSSDGYRLDGLDEKLFFDSEKCSSLFFSASFSEHFFRILPGSDSLSPSLLFVRGLFCWPIGLKTQFFLNLFIIHFPFYWSDACLIEASTCFLIHRNPAVQHKKR